MAELAEKTKSLLEFLKAAAALRRGRVAAYGEGDRLLWLADVPSHLPECRSPFFATDAGVMSDVWLEVRKRRMPARPPVPDAIRNWVSEDDLDNVETEPQLLAEITVPVEREFEADDAASQEGDAIPREISEVRRLEDYPEIQGAWLQYPARSPWGPAVHRGRLANPARPAGAPSMPGHRFEFLSAYGGGEAPAEPDEELPRPHMHVRAAWHAIEDGEERHQRGL